jgi:hypothetical protein
MSRIFSCRWGLTLVAIGLICSPAWAQEPSGRLSLAALDRDFVLEQRVEELEAEWAQRFEELERELARLRAGEEASREREELILERLPAVDGDQPVEETTQPPLPADKAEALPPPAPEKKDDKKGIATLTPLSGDCGSITFKPGLRVQSRYLYDDFTGNNDFFIRRFRLKCSGNAFEIANYGLELKIDSTGKIDTNPTPPAIVENAWLDFPLLKDAAYLRVGLYDAPFSRNALTSDSKLLLMDRSLIKEELTTVGITDNTIGLLLHGRPCGGYVEYGVGIFDDVAFERFGTVVTRNSNDLMPMGRVVWHLLDPATPADGYADERESYVGKGSRLDIGANAAYLSNCTDGVNEFDLHAWGVDLFYNSGPWVFTAEYDHGLEDMSGGATDLDIDGFYVQAGYLFCWCKTVCCPCDPVLELAARYQELDPLSSDNRLKWTSLGLNLYIRDHNLKIQTDYTFKDEEALAVDNNVFQLQLQLDY